MAVGFDNIDVKLVKTKKLSLLIHLKYLRKQLTELRFTLMLTVARRIVEAEKYVQDGQWKSWGPYLLSGKDVHGSTVGMVCDIGKSALVDFKDLIQLSCIIIVQDMKMQNQNLMQVMYPLIHY